MNECIVDTRNVFERWMKLKMKCISPRYQCADCAVFMTEPHDGHSISTKSYPSILQRLHQLSIYSNVIMHVEPRPPLTEADWGSRQGRYV
jgi:hypothetical protein